MSDSTEGLYLRVLILRGQTGDEAAFAELVERYDVRLRYYLRKMLGTNQIDDTLQDVWLDVFRALPRLLDPGAFGAWLYRIARDRAYRVQRRRRLPTQPLPEGIEAPDAEAEFDPADAAAIHAALDRLTPEHREALILRFIEEMTYEQIAEVVGVPLGTVRSRLHHAKRELRSILERANEHERERTGPGHVGV